MMCRASPRGGPAHDHHASAQVTDRVDPWLAVVAPQIGDVDREPGEHLGRVLEIEPALAQGPGALRRLEGGAHPELLYIQKRSDARGIGKARHSGTRVHLLMPLVPAEAGTQTRFPPPAFPQRNLSFAAGG